MKQEQERIRREGATDLGSLLARVVQEKKWQRRFQQHAVFDFWAESVGPEISARAQPSFIRGNVLWVRVSDSVWMQQLHLQKMLLLDIINQQLTQEKINDIRFQLDLTVGKTGIVKPATAENKRVDQGKMKEFENILAPLHNEELKASLFNLWIKSHSTR